MPYKKGDKRDWLVVGARVPPDLREWLLQKYPNDGDISKLILCLLKKVRDGKILGVRLEV
jgi:hypothetical protein